MCNAWNHSASCRCGWGGDGHLGKSGGFSGVASVWGHAYTDFCRQTKCPTCGDMVYFVRHNGGSVWFDELGKPWQKHGCFDTPYARSVEKQLTAYARGLSRPLLGVVIETLTFSDGSMKLTVRCVEIGQVISAYVKTDTPADRLLGVLVVVSPDDNRIVHKTLGNVPKDELNVDVAMKFLIESGLGEAQSQSLTRVYKDDKIGFDRSVEKNMASIIATVKRTANNVAHSSYSERVKQMETSVKESVRCAVVDGSLDVVSEEQAILLSETVKKHVAILIEKKSPSYQWMWDMVNDVVPMKPNPQDESYLPDFSVQEDDIITICYFDDRDAISSFRGINGGLYTHGGLSWRCTYPVVYGATSFTLHY